MLRGPNSGEIQPGDVIVIRFEGPSGGPGMREMLQVTGALVGLGLGDSVALVTDGRFSGARGRGDGKDLAWPCGGGPRPRRGHRQIQARA